MKKRWTVILLATCITVSFESGMNVEKKLAEKEQQQVVQETKKEMYEQFARGKNQNIELFPYYMEKNLAKEDQERFAVVLSNFLDIPLNDVKKKFEEKNNDGSLKQYVVLSKNVDYDKVQQLKQALNSDEKLVSFVGYSISKEWK